MTPTPEGRCLATEAYALADAHRAGRLTREAALAELARRCPGYRADEYERAFAQGLFESR